MKNIEPERVEVEIISMESEGDKGIQEAELDEMWSFVGKKKNPRWLWHAIDKLTCFSKTEEMHDLVIGLFINKYEFGLSL